MHSFVPSQVSRRLRSLIGLSYGRSWTIRRAGPSPHDRMANVGENKTMMKRTPLYGSWLGILSIVGCGGTEGSNEPAIVAIDAQGASAIVQARIQSALTGLAEGAETVDESAAFALAMDTADDGLLGCPPPADPLAPAPTEPAVPADGAQGLEGALRELSDTLTNEVFQDQFIESSDATTVVYLLDPAVVCDPLDAECVSELTANPIRFSVTNRADGSLYADILVGEARNNPATIILSETEARLQADLGEFRTVLSMLMSADQTGLPETLQGNIELAIVKNGEQDFSLEFSVLSDVAIVSNSGEPPVATSISIARAVPAAAVRFNAPAHSLTLTQDWRPIDLQLPGSVFCEGRTDCGDQELNGEFHAYLAGASSTVTATEGQSELVFDNVGLGNATSFIDLNSQPLVRLDINPNSDRRFSMGFQDTADGVLVTFQPELDLAVAVTLMNLSETLRVDLPEWLFDEVFNVTMTGQSMSQVLVPHADCATPDAPQAPLQVVTGTLTLSAASVANDVPVSAGMCLVEAPVVEGTVESTSGHPFESVAAGSCE